MPLIGKRNINNSNPFTFDSLKYGDVVEIVELNDGYKKNHLYIPKSVGCKITDEDSDVFISYENDLKTPHYEYWRASQFKKKFPYHNIWDNEVFIGNIVNHINEWEKLNSIDDLIEIFQKYNIDIRKQRI